MKSTIRRIKSSRHPLRALCLIALFSGLFGALLYSFARHCLDMEVDVASSRLLRFEMRSVELGNCQLYYDVGRGENEGDSKKFRHIGGDGFRQLCFPLPDKVMRLRLDPAEKDGHFEIRNMQILDSSRRVLADIPMQCVKALQQIKPLRVEGGTLYIDAEDGANDPMLLIDFSIPYALPKSTALTIFKNAVKFLVVYFIISIAFVSWQALSVFVNWVSARFLACFRHSAAASVQRLHLGCRVRLLRRLRERNLFFSMCAVLMTFIILSYPFLRLPYDMWAHLHQIATFFYADGGGTFNFGNYHAIWYLPWAWFLKFFGFPDDGILWARFIHVVQFLLVASGVFFFSKEALRVLLPGCRKVELPALGAALLWIFGTGTPSVAYQNAWILWYSVNPQGLTFAMLWFASGLLMRVIGGGMGIPSLFCHWAGMLLLLVGMIFIHPIEGAYFLVFIGFAVLFQAPAISKFIWRRWYWALPAAAAAPILVYFGAKHALNKGYVYTYMPLWDGVLKGGTPFKVVWDTILSHGDQAVPLSRYPDTYSEIAFLSVGVGLLILLCVVALRFPRWVAAAIRAPAIQIPDAEHVRPVSPRSRAVNLTCLAYFIALCAFFMSVPIWRPLAGLMASLIVTDQVYRFIYSAPWFIFLPLLFCVLCGRRGGLVFSLTVLVLVSLCAASASHFHHALFRNAKSIVESLSAGKVIEYWADLPRIRNHFERFIKEKGVKRGQLLNIRGDMGYIVKMMFGVNFMNAQRSVYPAPPGTVDAPLPFDFPRDETLFATFPGMDRPGDLFVNVAPAFSLPAITGELTAGSRIVQSFQASGALTHVELCCATFARRNTKDVILRVLSDNPDTGAELAMVIVNASEFRDNSWRRFSFPTVGLEQGKTYYLVLESSESCLGNAITVYGTEKDSYPSGSLSIGGKESGRDLGFRLWR